MLYIYINQKYVYTMTDYSNYTLAQFKVMSNKEFEAYTQTEYSAYMEDITHIEDTIPYSEFFIELEAMLGRRDKKYNFI